MGHSLKDLRDSDEVKADVGYLRLVQKGEKPSSAKPPKGFSGIGVFGIVADFEGDIWGAVYAVAGADAAYVLHFFRKKSKKGIGPAKREIDLIRKRLREAIASRFQAPGKAREKYWNGAAAPDAKIVKSNALSGRVGGGGFLRTPVQPSPCPSAHTPETLSFWPTAIHRRPYKGASIQVNYWGRYWGKAKARGCS